MRLLRVKEPFSAIRGDGVLVSFRKGQLVDASDPVASTHAHMLEQAAPDVGLAMPAAPVEQATAAPGEKRTVRTRKQQ